MPLPEGSSSLLLSNVLKPIMAYWFTFVVSLFCLASEKSTSETMAFANHVKRLPDLYWNTSNPIFRIDNTDHIIDVNQGRGRSLHDYDQINIICPVYATTVPTDSLEKFIIYVVSKDEYESCQIMNAHPRIIAQCDSPHQFRVFTISFRSFTPTPGALEFRPGTDYYFVSTSSKHDLHQRVNGMCRDNNMKVVFKVAEVNAAPPAVMTTTTTTAKTLSVPASVNSTGDNELHPPHDSSSFNEISDHSLSSGGHPADTDLSLTSSSSDVLLLLPVENDDLAAEEGEEPSEGRKNRRKKKKQQHHHRKRKKERNNREQSGSPSDNFFTAVENQEILNDNPPLISPPSNDAAPPSGRVIEKELSLVEKVNNLMKQEASIRASSSSNSQLWGGASFLFSALLLLEMIILL